MGTVVRDFGPNCIWFGPQSEISVQSGVRRYLVQYGPRKFCPYFPYRCVFFQKRFFRIGPVTDQLNWSVIAAVYLSEKYVFSDRTVTENRYLDQFGPRFW